MKQVERISYSWLGLVVGMLCFVALGGQAEARTLHVANNGSDSSVCGDKDRPCRSINQAITNARAGDGIVVGPGRYGDLNGNGIFGEPGEELLINKRVTLTSRDGALTTVLDGGGVASIPVEITASGVVFGRPGHGFLITGGRGTGLRCSFNTINVRVAGNVATENGGDGFAFNGNGAQVSNNLAVRNGNVGFTITGDGRGRNKGKPALRGCTAQGSILFIAPHPE